MTLIGGSTLLIYYWQDGNLKYWKILESTNQNPVAWDKNLHQQPVYGEYVGTCLHYVMVQTLCNHARQQLVQLNQWSRCWMPNHQNWKPVCQQESHRTDLHVH